MVNDIEYSSAKESYSNKNGSYISSRFRKGIMGLILGATLIYSAPGCTYNHTQKPSEDKDKTQETEDVGFIGFAIKEVLTAIPKAALEETTEKIKETNREKELEKRVE
jgi:hypothetical protein